jgi:hypothetical protein
MTGDQMFNETSLVVCYKSLVKLIGKMKQKDIENTVVFIDEINSFFSHLYNNDFLNDKKRQRLKLLMGFVVSCKKLVVADATITITSLALLDERIKHKPLFVRNDFKKYSGIKAHFMNDEYEFMEKLKRKLLTNKYFIYACVCRTKIARHYWNLYNLMPDNIRNDVILITADHKFNLKNASEQFSEKFVFHSPTLPIGVDVSLKKPQDVLFYANGFTVDPTVLLQMATRTRNIKNLYIYIYTGRTRIKAFCIRRWRR